MEENINSFLHVSGKGLCRLNPGMFLSKYGTAEIFQRGNLDCYIQHFSSSPNASRIYGKIMPSTIATTIASSTQSLNTVFLEEVRTFHSK